MSELTSEEWEDFGKIEKILEQICENSFNTTMFNVCFLMNNAYKDGIIPNVHCQFIPRYDKEVKLFDKEYVDKHFRYNFWKWDLNESESQKDIFTKEERLQIFNIMKEEYNRILLSKELL